MNRYTEIEESWEIQFLTEEETPALAVMIVVVGIVIVVLGVI